MEQRSVATATLLLVFLQLSLVPQCHGRPAFACGGGPMAALRFCRRDLPLHVRARDLVGRLTMEEKIRLLVNNAAGVPRLGIAGYEWWSEGLHGVSNTGPGVRFGGAFPGATSFPQVITSAASFNATLWELMGRVVSDEARAMYNGGQAGLTYWSPNVNIFRDPRWGRGQETPGEDPVVAGKYAAAYVRGLQQQYAGNRLKVAACCKHYTAYDLDNWKGTDRFHFDARVSRQDLTDTFGVPFRTCIAEGKVASVMCSYNKVNGVPSCADRDLLLNTVRGQWGLSGYIVSDCDSVGVFYNSQHYTRTPAEAAALAIKAGLDLDCGPFLAQYTGDALRENLLGPWDVDNALINTITVQMRLGMYDGDPSSQPFGNLGPQHVCTPQNQELALEAARQGIVLLKNDRRSLPFSSSPYRTVAVIGPNSDATKTMIGNYAGVPCRYTSPLEGIGRFARTNHQRGCNDVACMGNQLFDEAVVAARTSDATVLVMGLDQSVEAEARDREGLLLPGRQQELVSRVAAASRGPTILVLMCGGPVDITFAQNDPRVQAILWAGYPGQAGGEAIAQAIFGAFSPGGRLPMTWYPQEYVEKVPMTKMGMRENPSQGYPGRTYRFYKGPVVYPFGHGLSYTQIIHSIAYAPTSLSIQVNGKRIGSDLNSSALVSGRAVRVSHAHCESLSMDMHIDVKNIGEFDVSHVVLVFSTPPSVGKGSPSKQLLAFEKVRVAAKSEARVMLTISPCRDLSLVDSNGIARVPIGDHKFEVGEAAHVVSLRAQPMGVSP